MGGQLIRNRRPVEKFSPRLRPVGFREWVIEEAEINFRSLVEGVGFASFAARGVAPRGAEREGAELEITVLAEELVNPDQAEEQRRLLVTVTNFGTVTRGADGHC